MDDEKGLDLSLGLPCGGNSSSQNDKFGNSSDFRLGEGDRGIKVINEFKFFLEGGNQQDPLAVEENFYTNLAKPAVDLADGENINAGGIWLTNDSRSTEIEEEKRSISVGEKRRSSFIETNQQKKHESDAIHVDSTDKTKSPHISVTTDEGSAAANEDVAESEADGSNSRHVPQRDDVAKQFVDSSAVEISGQKRFTISSEKELDVMNKMPTLPQSVLFPGQPVNMNTSWTQPVNESNVSCLSRYPHCGVIQDRGTTNGERQDNQPVVPANIPLMFGYTPVHQQQMHSTYSGRNLMNPDVQNDIQKLSQVISHKSSESTQNGDRTSEHGKSNGKQQVVDEVHSPQTERDPRGNPTVRHVSGSSDQPGAADSIPCEFPGIMPGISPDLKFGGRGSYPNLPWVSTIGQGPDGQTISGVTYRYSSTQIRIVCACHGSHMSPEEFVRHAAAAKENDTPDSGIIGLASSYPSTDPAASAQS